MSGVGMPANLRLVLEHLSVVRELDRYLRKKGVDKDIERYVKESFRPALQERVPRLKEWHCDPGESGADWYPDSWKLEGDLYVCLSVFFPGPLDLDDPNPSVNVYVPTDWSGHSVFSDRSTGWVKTLLEDGFGFAADYHWDEELPVGKYVRWLEADGSFDEIKLVERIALEVEKIVRLDPEITATILEVSAQSVRTRTTRQSGPPKSHRGM
jgi:hypothetical protein